MSPIDTPTTGLTYDDLRNFPDDHLRREIIDGNLLVTAAPSTRHQRVVLAIARALLDYQDEQGGQTYPAPTDVYFAEDTVVEPDVVFITADHAERVEEAFIRGTPDLVVEVSSPSTRRTDLVRKRRLYEREAVAEYWFVDLDADHIEVNVLTHDGYASAGPLERDQILVSTALAGFSAPVSHLLPD